MATPFGAEPPVGVIPTAVSLPSGRTWKPVTVLLPALQAKSIRPLQLSSSEAFDTSGSTPFVRLHLGQPLDAGTQAAGREQADLGQPPVRAAGEGEDGVPLRGVGSWCRRPRPGPPSSSSAVGRRPAGPPRRKLSGRPRVGSSVALASHAPWGVAGPAWQRAGRGTCHVKQVIPAMGRKALDGRTIPGRPEGGGGPTTFGEWTGVNRRAGSRSAARCRVAGRR